MSQAKTADGVALVTGAARRVGRCVAERMAEHGLAVVVHYHRSAAEAEAAVRAIEARHGVRAVALQADLTNATAAERLVERTVELFGRLDVVVTCASVWRPVELEQADGQALEAMWRANTLSCYVPAWRGGLQMARQTSGGCIVLIGDWAVARPYRSYAPYLVAKGAIPTMTKVLAVELAARNPNVRVNAILPGPVLLPEGTDEAAEAAVRAATLVKRLGTPSDVADLVWYFVEHPFVTGAVVPVDGGRSIYAPGEDAEHGALS